MSAGSQIVLLRKGLERITRYATHLPQCHGDERCSCGLLDARREANRLAKINPARSGRPSTKAS